MNSKLSNIQSAIIAGLLAQVIWGFAGPLVKIALYSVPPFSLFFLRCLFTSLILFVVYEIKWAKEFAFGKIPFEDKKDIFWGGFYGVFLNICLYFVAQSSTTVSDAWVIGSSGTIFVVILSYIFLKERLPKHVYGGIFVAFIGTLVIIGEPILKIGSGGAMGNTLMLLATLSAAVSTFYVKKVVAKYPPLLLTFFFFLISLPFITPLFIWEFIKQPLWMGTLDPINYLIIAYLAVGSSILAYSLSNLSLIKLSHSVASSIGYFGAIISIGLSIFLLHEKITPYFIVGTILIILGLGLSETRHRKSSPSKI